jgi:hypothetical protein
MSHSATSKARAFKHIDSGREMNKTRKIGWGVITVSCILVNPSGTIQPRPDYFFPMGSVVIMK